MAPTSTRPPELEGDRLVVKSHLDSGEVDSDSVEPSLPDPRKQRCRRGTRMPSVSFDFDVTARLTGGAAKTASTTMHWTVGVDEYDGTTPPGSSDQSLTLADAIGAALLLLSGVTAMVVARRRRTDGR